MFESNQDLKKYFEKFKDMSNDALFRSQLLLNHATTVMESIDTFATELEDAEKTHQKIKKLGSEHKLRGIKEEHLHNYPSGGTGPNQGKKPVSQPPPQKGQAYRGVCACDQDKYHAVVYLLQYLYNFVGGVDQVVRRACRIEEYHTGSEYRK